MPLPQSWVTPEAPETLLITLDEEPEDWFETDAQWDETGTVEPDAVVRAEFNRLCDIVGVAPFPLRILHKEVLRQGFVRGRVRHVEPHWMRLTLSPNSDRGETFATLVHEFAHLYVPDHSLAFKETMVDLACGAYGDAYFTQARRLTHERTTVVDLWVAVGIRAALANATPVAMKQARHEERLLKVVDKIQKLQRLANRNPGTHEACAACGLANTLVAQYGLQEYRMVLPDASIDEEMADIWLEVGRRIPWKRRIGHAMATHCNCFSLYQSRTGLMHFFGKYGDLMHAEQLVKAHIPLLECQAERYMTTQRIKLGCFERGEARTLRAAFLNSAAIALQCKIEKAKRDERAYAAANAEAVMSKATALTLNDLSNAEVFAAELFEDRGKMWSSGRSQRYTHSEAGANAGRNARLSRGVGVATQRRLT